MASLDFEQEKRAFRKFYDNNRSHFEEAKNAYIRVIKAMLKDSGIEEVTKIEGRIKEREECVKKFQRKYQSKLEADEIPYEIKDYISDLLGIRIVCLYDDQVGAVFESLKEHFRIIDVTDKITALESTEDLFGYKGLHMDLAPKTEIASRFGSHTFAAYPFEVQIRSLIQDAWSVLDHKIKYKKSIPNDLKRRINVLSALFELADREFREIRNATQELLQQETATPVSDVANSGEGVNGEGLAAVSGKTINAFSFLRIVGHFFRDFEFADYKVDNFVQVILKMNPGFQKSDLHKSLIENLKTVKDYHQDYLEENPDNSFSPYTVIRHCLYLYDPQTFGRILSRGPRERFEAWLRQAR